MKKPQKSKSRDRVLDAFCARYENRSRNYTGAKESTEQELREIESRSISPSSYRLSLSDERRRGSMSITDGDFVDYCTSSRERAPIHDAELDGRIVLQDIDRERYKKVSPKQTEVKRTDVGATLRRRSGKRIETSEDIPREKPSDEPKKPREKREDRRIALPVWATVPLILVGLSVILIIISIILLFRI